MAELGTRRTGVWNTTGTHPHPTPIAVELTSACSPYYLVKMQYVAAYLLLVAGGNTTPSAEDITSLLSTVE